MPICNLTLFKFKSVKTVGALDNKHPKMDLLWEFPTDPGCSIQHFTDAHSLHVACQKVGIVEQSGHLSDSKAPDGFDPNRYIQHLRSDEMAMPGAL